MSDRREEMQGIDELGRRDVRAELALEDLALERAAAALDGVIPPALTDFLD